MLVLCLAANSRRKCCGFGFRSERQQDLRCCCAQLCPSVFVGSNLSPVGTIMFPGGRVPNAALDPGGTSTSIGPDVEMLRCQKFFIQFAKYFQFSGFRFSHVPRSPMGGVGTRWKDTQPFQQFSNNLLEPGANYTFALFVLSLVSC